MTATTNGAARIGAGCYTLWGLLHVFGGALQLATLKGEGAGALTRMISSARPLGPGDAVVPPAAAAFMGMGAFNILWIGLLVIVIAVTMNWRNSRLGYWFNLGIVGATDLGLLVALVRPGIMAWSDGGLGLSLYVTAAVASSLGRIRGRGIPAPVRV